MEIYSDLSSAASKEFEQLLKTHQSKTPIEEGKIIEGVVNKITEKYVFLYIPNLKSEPITAPQYGDRYWFKGSCGELNSSDTVIRYSAKSNPPISKNELLVKTKNQAVSYLLFL